jgi:hypothetical protein
LESFEIDCVALIVLNDKFVSAKFAAEHHGIRRGLMHHDAKYFYVAVYFGFHLAIKQRARQPIHEKTKMNSESS